MKESSISQTFFVSGKKLRKMISRNDTANAKSKKMRPIAVPQFSNLLPVMLAPSNQIYPVRKRKKAVAKFSGVTLNFIDLKGRFLINVF